MLRQTGGAAARSQSADGPQQQAAEPIAEELARFGTIGNMAAWGGLIGSPAEETTSSLPPELPGHD
eukprot:6356596-Alexandrium_andersonii.AAC.1